MKRRAVPKRRSAPVPALPPVTAEVRNVAGQVICIDLDPHSTVRSLKQKLAEHWPKSPPICQRLLLGGAEALTDSQELGALLASPETANKDNNAEGHSQWPGYGGSLHEEATQVLRFLMVVSLEDAQQALSSTSGTLRVEALEALSVVAPKGSRGACAAVSQLLQDEAPEVRQAALASLLKISPEGDGRAKAAVLHQLKEDTEGFVRVAALKVLMSTLPAGCRHSIDAIAQRLTDQDPYVVQTVEKALTSLSFRPDSSAPSSADATAALLTCRRADVRLAAVRTITAMGVAVATRVVDRLGPVLEDKDKRVRQQAQVALARLLPDPHERALASARARLLYSSTLSAKVGAMKELARDAPMEDDKTILAACSAVRERSKGLQIEAMKALPSLVAPGHELAVSCVLECLEDAPGEVRLAALKVLPKLAQSLDIKALQALRALQGHSQLGEEASRSLRLLDVGSKASSCEPARLDLKPTSNGYPNYDSLDIAIQEDIQASAFKRVLSEPSLAQPRERIKQAAFRKPGGFVIDRNPLLSAALDMVVIDQPAWRKR